MKWLACIAALCCAAPVAQAGEWTDVEFRGGLDLVEVVAPLFGEPGRVQASPGLLLGLGWRQFDPDELENDPSADGLKPIGVYGGVGFSIDDQFGFSWVQLQAGVTYEDVLSVGLGGWVGNRTITAEDGSTTTTPGLDFKLKSPIIGIGLQADPE